MICRYSSMQSTGQSMAVGLSVAGVGKPRKNAMHCANTVQLDSHAAATLRYIRASMESASSPAVPGSTGIASGIVGVGATIVSSIPVMRPYWLIVWLLAAVVAVVAGGTCCSGRRRSAGSPSGCIKLRGHLSPQSGRKHSEQYSKRRLRAFEVANAIVRAPRPSNAILGRHT